MRIGLGKRGENLMNIVEERPTHDGGQHPALGEAPSAPANVSTESTSGGRALAISYLGRRLPWGTPWWPYAVVLAVANFARQLIQPDDISTSMELAIFVLMVGTVIGVVTLVHKVLWPSPRQASSHIHRTTEIRQEEPGSSQQRQVSSVKPERPMASGGSNTDQQLRQKSGSKWAPWWWYVIPILGVNYVRQGLMPVGTVPEWAVVLIVLAISTVLFVAITYAYRVSSRSR